MDIIIIGGLLGGAYALMAMGLQLQYGVARIMNLANGEMLVVGWGSTKGTIEEAVDRLRRDGRRVASVNLRFLQPMASGIGQMLGRFDKVMTIESSWCDSPDEELVDGDNRRFSALAMLLRARFLADVECWSEVRGQPIKPRTIARVIEDRLQLGA